MGTLNDILRKLTYLEGTKEQIRQAIESKGVSVPTSTKFADYPGKIDQIPTEKGNNARWVVSNTMFSDHPDSYSYTGTGGIQTVEVQGDTRLASRFNKFCFAGGVKFGPYTNQGLAKRSTIWNYSTTRVPDKYRNMVTIALQKHPAIKSTYNCKHLIIAYYDGIYWLYFLPVSFKLLIGDSGKQFLYSTLDAATHCLTQNVYWVCVGVRPDRVSQYNYIGEFSDTYNGLQLDKIRWSNVPIYIRHICLWPDNPHTMFNSLNGCDML